VGGTDISESHAAGSTFDFMSAGEDGRNPDVSPIDVDEQWKGYGKRVESFGMWYVSMLVSIALLCGYPILIACLWLMRLRQMPQSPRWRGVMSWVSISLATAALGAWTGTLTGMHHQNLEQLIQHLHHGVNTSLAFCAAAFVTALFAKGKVRVWSAVSALVVPLYFSLGWIASRYSG